jgi:hypothetical protein
MSDLTNWFWRLRARLAEYPPPRWHREARRAGFYPAYADFVGCFVLDASGEVWCRADDVSWTQMARVQEPELRHVARVQAARWSRSMRAFSPRRDAAAKTCPSCHGAGSPVPPRWQHKILCECGGTGWVPGGWGSGRARSRSSSARAHRSAAGL